MVTLPARQRNYDSVPVREGGRCVPSVLIAHDGQVDRADGSGRHRSGLMARQRAIGWDAGQAATPASPVRLTFPERIVIIGAVKASTPDALHAGVLHQRRDMV